MEEKCQVLKDKEFKICHGKVNPGDYIANCEYDDGLCKKERDDCY